MKVLQRWFGVCRWTYNQCAAAINNNTVPANSKSMRAAFVNNGNFLQANQWVTEVPYDVRDQAMQDALKALAAYEAKQEENQNGFHLKFRSRMDPTQSLVIRKRDWSNRSGLFSSLFSYCYDKKHRHLLHKLPSDSRLVRDKRRR